MVMQIRFTTKLYGFFHANKIYCRLTKTGIKTLSCNKFKQDDTSLSALICSSTDSPAHLKAPDKFKSGLG